MRKEGFVEVETIVMKRRETFNSWEVLFSFLNSVWKLDGSLEPQPLRRAYMPGEIDGMGASSLGWNRFRRDSVGFRFSLFLSSLPFSPISFDFVVASVSLSFSTRQDQAFRLRFKLAHSSFTFFLHHLQYSLLSFSSSWFRPRE